MISNWSVDTGPAWKGASVVINKMRVHNALKQRKADLLV